MFKLPGTPSPTSDVGELADYMELRSWMTGAMSSRDMVSFLGQVDDNQNNEGIQDDENATTDKIDEVMQEIEQRHLACGGGYPFILRHEGTVLECAALDDRVQRIAYRYLLLCTRLRMDRSRVQAGLDGANLMERLSAHVLANYLGSARCQSLVFGTSAGGSFSDRVEKLCSALGEGGGLRPLAGVTPPASGDAKLDVVAWIPFRDRQPGQLVVFGQCKTGTNWRDTVGELQPDSFVKKWLRGPPLVDPIRAFLIAEAQDRGRWDVVADTGVFFDRCRIVDLCTGMPPDLAQDVGNWTSGAFDSVAPLLS